MNNTNEIKYIPMYKSYIDAVAQLSNEDRLEFYEAIYSYGFTGIEPTFKNPYLKMGWDLVKPNLDNNINNVIKNQENGKKGGRPVKVNKIEKEKSSIQEESKVSENINNNINASISDTQTEEIHPTINKEEIVENKKYYDNYEDSILDLISDSNDSIQESVDEEPKQKKSKYEQLIDELPPPPKDFVPID